jgi:flagellar biogenesis protein FliO
MMILLIIIASPQIFLLLKFLLVLIIVMSYKFRRLTAWEARSPGSIKRIERGNLTMKRVWIRALPVSVALVGLVVAMLVPARIATAAEVDPDRETAGAIF